MLLVLGLWPGALWAQALGQTAEVPTPVMEPQREQGAPYFFEHFSRDDYRHHHQNWAVAQDPRGVVYVANYDGLLEYDGVEWRFIETPLNTVVRSLGIDAAGTVYAGTRGDFGYLAPDTAGVLSFVSLRPRVAEQHRAVQDVWGTHVADDGVYFQTTDRLFHWDGEAVAVKESAQGFHTSFVVGGQFYVRERGVGLLRMRGGTLEPVPGGRRFAEERIYVMLPFGDGRTLIGTREAGFFLFDGRTFQAWPTEIDGLLRQYRLYHGAALPGGLFALATLDDGGVFVLDRQGRLVEHLDETRGLDDWVNYVYADQQGGLWLALDNHGVIRLDFPSQLSVFGRDHGLSGLITHISRHHGHLYVATTKGVYRLQPTTTRPDGASEPAAFEQVLDQKAFTVRATDEHLLIASGSGLYALRAGQAGAPALISPGDISLMKALEGFPRHFLVGTDTGLALLRPAPEGWALLPRIGGIDEPVRSIGQAEGKVWVATASGRLLRLALGRDPAAPVVEEFESPAPDVGVALLQGTPVFVTEEGLYRYDAATPEAPFRRDARLSEAAGQDSLLSFLTQADSTVWMAYADRVEILTPQPDGTYRRTVPPVLRFPKSDLLELYVEPSGVAWIGNGEKLIRYDPRVARRYDAPFQALVRRVTSASTGQVLYGGARRAAGVPVFAPFHDDLLVEAAAPSFNDPRQNQYQFYLEGEDDGWTAWTPNPQRRYTDLGGGLYALRVRARNGQGVVSEAAVFGFRLLPPWYRTGWAYGLYGLGLLLLGVASWRYYTVLHENKRAREQARELARERYVNERLQQANERLQQANERLRQAGLLKDEFLANTSHELRTPLTAILGFASILKEELPAGYLDFLDPIESNGQRLLRTVNSLLDIARLRAGMMEVRPNVFDVAEKAAEAIRLLGPLARQKDLLLELIRPVQPVLVRADEQLFESVLNNLIGNAVKFTREGRVSVEVEAHGDRACLRVRDTGVGIDAAFLPHLFDEFKQESTGLARTHEGSGLGLAITKKLVELMEGEITVHSVKGEGSVFTVAFPLHVAEPAPETVER